MGLTRHKFLDLAHSTAALTMDLDWNLKIGVWLELMVYMLNQCIAVINISQGSA